MRPVILAVDDDSDVLRAVERDLRKQYGNRFKIMGIDSGISAIDLLKRLKLRNESIALFIVDQRMPQMTGVDFLERAMEIFPETKRVLLTAYADTDAAIRSINKAKIEFYLMKPWTPPEQNLYPVLDDLLDDWMSSFHPPFEGIRVVGLRWSPKSYEVKAFLARNGIPFQWLDIEADEEASNLALYSVNSNSARSDLSNNNIKNNDITNLPHFPLVLFPDGSQLIEPTNAELAEKIGLKTHAEMPFYDLIIIGAGPAGLAASVYGASEGLHTLLIEREAPGGQAGMSSNIENYLGFPTGLTGSNLTKRAVAQATRFGVEILSPQEVIGLRIDGPFRYVKLSDGNEINCHALIITTGVSYRKLNIPGIEKLTGAGVYYGADMVQAISCQREDVYMIGGGNSAGQAAIFFSKYARKVTLLIRGNSIAKGMSKYLIDLISKTKNIEFWLNCEVIDVKGETRLEEIVVHDVKKDEKKTLPTSSLFVFIGAQPHTNWLAGIVERDQNGFILTGPDLIRFGDNKNSHPRGWTLERDPFLLETNIPGVFAAGDVRLGSIKRVASGVGEGSIAIQFVHQYLNKV